MAQLLHDKYNYSFDNLKVLAGGWGTWNEKHGTDPNGYPTATGGADTSVPADTKAVASPDTK